MRTEEEMYDLILNYARADERVRCVYMNGSRANPMAPKDPYRDFDIVYVVTSVEDFTLHPDWIDVFGERLILQTPETMRYPDGDGHFTWLMLFTDGNRIDLTLLPVDRPDLIENDSATIVLLDKDQLLPSFGPNSDSDYIVKKPDQLFFDSCCNNFFWCMQNVAKGIARDELPYAMGMYNNWVRNELHDMISWYIGTRTDFQVSTGKLGKYFKTYLPEDLYQMYQDTYSDADYEHLWKAVFTAYDLFRLIAKETAVYFGYSYRTKDEEGILKYLHMMK